MASIDPILSSFPVHTYYGNREPMASKHRNHHLDWIAAEQPFYLDNIRIVKGMLLGKLESLAPSLTHQARCYN